MKEIKLIDNKKEYLKSLINKKRKKGKFDKNFLKSRN